MEEERPQRRRRRSTSTVVNLAPAQLPGDNKSQAVVKEWGVQLNRALKEIEPSLGVQDWENTDLGAQFILKETSVLYKEEVKDKVRGLFGVRGSVTPKEYRFPGEKRASLRTPAKDTLMVEVAAELERLSWWRAGPKELVYGALILLVLYLAYIIVG